MKYIREFRDRDLARSLAADPDNLPARVVAFLGGALGRGDAANETEEP